MAHDALVLGLELQHQILVDQKLTKLLYARPAMPSASPTPTTSTKTSLPTLKVPLRLRHGALLTPCLPENVHVLQA